MIFSVIQEKALQLLMIQRDYLNSFEIFAQGKACDPGSQFFGFPTWYKYLGGQRDGGSCVPVISQLSDVWLIVLAIIEALLRVAAIAAVVWVVYGGVRFITAQGNPEKITAARVHIQDALIGLIIAVISIAVVNFVGSRF